ncbi:MAG: DinB family protein [Planctomycetota bacterium]
MYPRPSDAELPAFLRAYMDQVPDGDVLAMLAEQGRHVGAVLAALPAERAGYRYAEGKWSIARLVQHVIDGERLFCYRALCIARGDTQSLPGFDENAYAEHDGSDARTLDSLSAEHAAVRRATLTLFAGFDAAARERRGTANNKPASVAAMPWIIAGHERHHLRILQERYEVARAAEIAPEAPFGRQLYDELRSAGLLSLLTHKLDYAAIQKLKVADRDGVLALFPKAEFAFRQRLRNESARQVAAAMVEARRMDERHMLFMLFAML